MADEKNTVTVELGELTQSCFVIMPFAGTFNTVYERVIRPAVEEAGLACVRADELFSRFQITHDIWKQIRSCRLVLAELSGRNPNVLYELGLAHALGKPAIIITRKEDDVPFDLKALRYRYYDTDDPYWGETLKQSLKEMCRKVVEQKDFGSVFEGITLAGDFTFPEAPPAPVHPVQTFDVTGVWQGIAHWQGVTGENSWEEAWNLHLVQNAGILNGTLAVSFAIEDQLTVVQQTVVGEISESRINLHSTSYSYLQQGRSTDYSLDRFVGKLSEDSQKIGGVISDESDESDNSGELILSRVLLGSGFREGHARLSPGTAAPSARISPGGGR